MPPRDRILGYALLAAGMGLVGTYVALSKPLTAALPVFVLAWLRFGIAAVAMLPWTFGGRGDARLTRGQWAALFVQSFFGNFLFSIFMLTGVSMTSASAAGLVLATLPAVVALFSRLLLREPQTGRTWLAVALAVAGVAVLTLARGASSQGESAAGNLLVFACVCCEAVYVIVGKRLSASLSAMRISALINLFGLALTTPLGLAQAHGFDFGSVAAPTWALLGFYSLSASVFSTWLWLSGLRLVPAGQSGVFTIAMPLAACLVGVAWLGEHLGAMHFAAFGLAAAGVVLIAWPASRSASGRI